ncbi:MAG TPA: alpha/beta hydrolase [Candidatus Saccharimonadales bacterium]|nr:alpha/beta hydrolase [Candidatus Saccharimonadales bacterium]
MTFKNAIILHGTMGSPDINWFQWLKTELTTRGLQMWLPQLPNPSQPSLRQEADYVQAECPFAINQETLVIGHSSGAILALILAQENQVPIGAVVAVSVFHDNSLKWDANNSLFDVAFDWAAIQQGAGQLLFVHSDNDPYVPLEQAQFVADNCQAEMVVVPGEGHFNLERSEAYRAFPRLLALLDQKEILRR